MCNFAGGVCEFAESDKQLILNLSASCEAEGSPLSDVDTEFCEVDCDSAFYELFHACGYSDPTGPYTSVTKAIDEGLEMSPGGRRPINHTACCHVSEPGGDGFHWLALKARCHCNNYHYYETKLFEVSLVTILGAKFRELMRKGAQIRVWVMLCGKRRGYIECRDVVGFGLI